GRARAPRLRARGDAAALLRALRGAGHGTRHARATSGRPSLHGGTDMTQPNGTNLPTVCVLCSHNCGLRVDVVDGRIVEVRADETNPITKGYICNKAFEIDHYVEHGDRVRHPMRRRPDGTFEEVDWDTAS